MLHYELEFTKHNNHIIDIIKPYININSTVKITGYTDKLGDAAQNQFLAEQRAKSTAKELGVMITNELVQGKGNSATFDPELPEGRLYTRTVDVIIETKITN